VKHRRLVLLSVCVAVLAVIAGVLAASLGSASAETAGADTIIGRNLEAQGIKATSVGLQEGGLEVTLSSRKGGAPEDTWARTVIHREAAFVAASGDPGATQLGITILDEQGNVIYRYEGPIEPRARPSAKNNPLDGLVGIETDLSAQAQKLGVVLGSLSLDADASQGLVVDASASVTASPGEERDLQIQWATVGLLGELRDYCEGAGRLDVDLYRLTVDDGNGNVLVSYVVDPRTRSVRAWMASGVTPVWSQSQPAGLPGGPVAAP